MDARGPRFEASRPAATRARRMGYLLGSAAWVVALVLALVWLVSGLAALRDELPAIFRGPRGRVSWDVPRDVSAP